MNLSWIGLILLGLGLWFFARWFLGVGVGGAPFLPVRKQDIEDAMELAQVGPTDVVVDLGSGDGRVLLAAAERGASVIGYEISPPLVWLSRFKLRPFGSHAKILRTNLFSADLSQATVVCIFGITKMMPKVAELIRRSAPSNVRIISFAFQFPGLRPTAERGIVKLYRFV